ncbi:hypothetical protein Tco_1037132 [Tanacetum coccineum]
MSSPTKLEEDLEDSSKQGRMIEEIDQDAGVTLVTPTQGEDQPEDQLGVLNAAKILVDSAKTNVYTYTRRRRAVSTGSGGISTASRLFSTAEESVSTAGASMPVSTVGMVQEVNISIPSPVVIKDKENIKARVEADEEISKRLQAVERNKYNEVDQAKMLVDLINQRKKYFTAQKAEAKRNKPMTCDNRDLSSQGGSPAGIHGLFSGWYCDLANRKVTLGVSMSWANGGNHRDLGNLLEDKEVRRSGYYFDCLYLISCDLSLDKLAMPPHLHNKFRMGFAIAKGFKGEEILKIETTVTAKDGTITKFPGKFPEYKPTKEEEEIFKLKAICENVIYDISDSDSDLKSTAGSGPKDSEIEDTGGIGI